VFTDRRLRLRYRHGRDNRVRSYTLDPYGLVNKAGVWYLVADHHGQPQLFRADRALSATMLDEPVQRRDAAAQPQHRVRAVLPAGAWVPHWALRSPADIPDDDWRKTSPRFVGEAFAQNPRLVDEVRGVGDEVGATPAHVALAWLLAQDDDIAPIPGTRRVARVEENRAADAVVLTASQLARLDQLTPAIGARHDDASMAAIDR
jgi:hypothetical protein